MRPCIIKKKDSQRPKNRTNSTREFSEQFEGCVGGRDSQPRPWPRLNSQPQGATELLAQLNRMALFQVRVLKKGSDTFGSAFNSWFRMSVCAKASWEPIWPQNPARPPNPPGTLAEFLLSAGQRPNEFQWVPHIFPESPHMNLLGDKLECRKWGFKRWGFKQIWGYLRKKAFFFRFLDFPGALRTLRKRAEKGRKRPISADFQEGRPDTP